MSNFTLALAILGGLVLAVVVSHGAWISHKNRIRQADQRDVLPAREADGSPVYDRVERVDQTLHAADGRVLDAYDIGVTPTQFQDESLAEVMAIVAHADKKPKLDALLDSIATLSPEAPVSGDAVLAVFPSTRRVGSKPILIEVMDEDTEEWIFPQLGGRYSKVQAGVQMANRTGALSEIEFSEFVVKVQAIADSLNASAEFPEMLAEVHKARELDQFAAAHDAQLSMHLFSKRIAWSAGFVQQCAGRLGFIAGSLPGRMVLPAKQAGLPPFIALNFDSHAALSQDLDGPGLRRLSLTLDVPQVDRQENPFVLMRQIAEMLAVSMDAVVADEQGMPVDAATLNMIEADLQQLYDRLESRDLHAGSALARRLFS
jgi:ZipA, C-terminal FtsZ-binding domain